MFPGLQLEDEGNRVLFRGPFPVRTDGAGTPRDQFSIEVEVSPDSPKGMPVVREVANRVPRTQDRHVNDDGTLCVLLPHSYAYHCRDGLDLDEYLDGPLRAHLAGQLLAEIGEPWPLGEWNHGVLGVLDFYAEILGTRELGILRGLLELLARQELKGEHRCPCGSGRDLRRCHGSRVFFVRSRLSARFARQALKQLSPTAEGTAKRDGRRSPN